MKEKETTEKADEIEVMFGDVDMEAIAEEFDNKTNKPMMFEINKEKEKIFPVTVGVDETRFRPTQMFYVHLHENLSKQYPVDEDSKLLVATMAPNEKFFAKLFQVDKDGNDGKTYRVIGLEMRDKDGTKIDYTTNSKDKDGNRIKGFWLSKNERTALKRMGYLNLVEKK